MKKYAELAVVNSKIFSFADCLFSFFPKGAVLSSILRVRFYRIHFGESLPVGNALGVQKSALIMNEITASKIGCVRWGGDRYQLTAASTAASTFIIDRKAVVVSAVCAFKTDDLGTAASA
jgi:hypothetical protein